MTEKGARINDLIAYFGMNKNSFSREIGMKNNVTIGRILNEDRNPSEKTVQMILDRFPQVNPNWLKLGMPPMMLDGEMLKAAAPARRKIPVYDTQTIGGHNAVVANTNEGGQITEEIDAGDWFPEATAAIHHYGDSMVEYPSGSILALKRVHDRRLIINGRNYVIETTEYRITKQLQYNGGEYMMAYSTNTEKYPDGNLIHAPIKIPVETIRHIDLVLGCVTKEYSNGAVIIRKR